jgi:hypothetical protein
MATRLVIGTLLVTAAVVAWNAASIADDLAARHEAVATLQPLPAEAPARGIGSWRERLIALVDRTAAQQDGSSRYWQGDYRSLTDPARAVADDRGLLIVSANAALRQAQREAGGRPVSVDRLDQVLQAYASVLRNVGFDRDAAFNYEYVSRLRDTVARAKPTGARPEAARQQAPAGPPQPAPGDLPVGPTIHGRPGTHPPASRGEEFEIITPMNYGDREAQPEPTPGVKLPKKG